MSVSFSQLLAGVSLEQRSVYVTLGTPLIGIKITNII